MMKRSGVQVDLGRGDTGVFPMEKLIKLYMLCELARIYVAVQQQVYLNKNTLCFFNQLKIMATIFCEVVSVFTNFSCCQWWWWIQVSSSSCRISFSLSLGRKYSLVVPLNILCQFHFAKTSCPAAFIARANPCQAGVIVSVFICNKVHLGWVSCSTSHSGRA